MSKPLKFKAILDRMVEIKKREPLTIKQMLDYDMIAYTERVRAQAIQELKEEETLN